MKINASVEVNSRAKHMFYKVDRDSVCKCRDETQT